MSNGTTVLEPPLSLDWPVLPEPAQGKMTKIDRSLKFTFLIILEGSMTHLQALQISMKSLLGFTPVR